MIHLIIDKMSDKYYSIEIKPDMSLNYGDLIHRPTKNYNNGKISVKFSDYGGTSIMRYDSYKFEIPLLHTYNSWWNTVQRAHLFLYYFKKFLTDCNIPFKVISNGDNRFQLTNEKGKVYAYYL